MEPRSGRSILVTGVYMLYFDTTRRRLVFTTRTVLSIFFVAVQSCQDDRDQQVVGYECDTHNPSQSIRLAGPDHPAWFVPGLR